jgi:dipeptidyl aminopeptidase/acylaminoacyl peptidase
MSRIPAARVGIVLALAFALAWTSVPAARQGRTLAPEDYGRWETLVAQRTPLSPDGRWLVHGITRGNGQHELRVQPTAGGAPVVIPFGEQPAFSDDSKWMAYLIGFSEDEEAKLRKDRKPLHKKLGLLDLASGVTLKVDGIESFSLSPSGSHVAMRRYGPDALREGDPASREPADAERVNPGTTLVVRNLATNRDATFGSVSESAWRDAGAVLAMVMTVDGGVGNGVQAFDAASGILRVLDSSSSTYSGLAWRKDGSSLAVLRSSANDAREGATHVALAWPDAVGAPANVRVLDAARAGLAADLRVVGFRAPRWSEDGSLLFVGVGPWPAKVAPFDPAGASRREAATSTNPDELPDVQVWHPKDATVMARQKVDARRDRERSMLAAWWVDEGRLVRIANAMGEEASPIRRSTRALVVDTNAFAMERSIGRVFGNVWSVELKSGSRTIVGDRIEDRFVQSSPGGRYVLYIKNDQYWTVDLASGRQTNVTAGIATSFVDRESDDTSPSKPPFGVAGWSRDDRTVLLYDKLDIWEIRPDGSGATRLTSGATGEIRHRYVRLDPDEEWIDRDQPMLVSQFGMKSKQSGYARVGAGPGAPQVTSLVRLDKRVTALAKAKRADRFAYTVQAFDDSPDYFAAGPALDEATQVSATNPFMRDYAWGRSTLVEFRNAQGQPTQGVLTYPAGYEAGRKYPMVVYMYETLSDGLHLFSTPSERQYYNPAAFTQRGYFYLQPDIVFRPREPGLSVVDAVVPAVKRVVDMGLADPARVGIIGHSWGGFDTVYLATRTDVFAAAVAGAPITDLVSNYGNHHWSSGIAETDHIETGQQRMVVPLYEDLQAYVRNSAIYSAHTMKTPLLIEVGDNDGTVHWHQGVALYNIARRAGKNVVLLQYGGEDHGLRKKANQIDYHHRIFEWFDHYLAGRPAAPWITNGERFLDRERDLRQRKTPAKPAVTTTAAAPPG